MGTNGFERFLISFVMLIVYYEEYKHQIKIVMNSRFPRGLAKFGFSYSQSSCSEVSGLARHCLLLTGKHLQKIHTRKHLHFQGQAVLRYGVIRQQSLIFFINSSFYVQILEPLKYIRTNSAANHSDFSFSDISSRPVSCRPQKLDKSVIFGSIFLPIFFWQVSYIC